MKGASGCCQMVMHDPRAQHPGQMFLTGSQFWRGRKTRVPGEKPSNQLRWTETQPNMIAEVGDPNVEYNANLTSQGIQHMDTKIVAHLDINPAQQDLTSAMKWKSLFSLGQAV